MPQSSSSAGPKIGPKICILGGGFGGLYTALRLSQLPWDDAGKPEITLVDQNDRFVFLPLLYELLSQELESWEIAPPFEELLANTGVHFIQGKASSLNLEQQQVQLEDGQTLAYDRIVLAVGGETRLDLVPGAGDHAIPFRTLADAYRVEERLRQLEQELAAGKRDRVRVAIAGGGYSGVELACKIAERLGSAGRVRIVEMTDQILRNSPEFNRESARTALEKQGVWLDLETRIEAVRIQDEREDGAEASGLVMDLKYKEQLDTIPVDLLLWTVGTSVVPLVKDLPLPKNERQQILVDNTLQVTDHANLFALGDLAYGLDADGQPVPPTAQAAFQQADYAGWNVWASLRNKPLLPFRYQNLGEMMSLGSDAATLTGLGITLNGPLAHVARRMIYLYRMPTLDHQLRVGFNWITKPLQDLLKDVA